LPERPAEHGAPPSAVPPARGARGFGGNGSRGALCFRRPALLFDAFGREVARRATAEGVTTTGYGIGGCDREPDALRISIDDWRSANRMVQIIEEEAARWDVAGSIAVLVAGIPIATPL